MKPYYPTFFPDTAFAWVFCLILLGFAVAAAVIDTRRAIVPNRLTVPMLAAGIVMNAIRAGWLGSQGNGLWCPWIETGSFALGALDGILFSLVGFAFAFGILLIVWMLNQCGGGDVKLAAAIGGWVGYLFFFYIWVVAIAVVAVFMIVRLASAGFAVQKVRKQQAAARSLPPGKRPKLRVTFSLPLTIALTFVLVWVFKVELMLAAPKPQPEQPQGSTSHAPHSPRTT